jgi:hypothetical protein
MPCHHTSHPAIDSNELLKTHPVDNGKIGPLWTRDGAAVETSAKIADSVRMGRLMKYSVAGIVLSSIADGLGASMGVTLMSGFIGPPLLYMAWLAIRKPHG